MREKPPELTHPQLIQGRRTVAQMDELFAVDAEARRKTLTTAARHIRRQETARPLLDDIRSKIDAAQSAALPSSALSRPDLLRQRFCQCGRALPKEALWLPILWHRRAKNTPERKH